MSSEYTRGTYFSSRLSQDAKRNQLWAVLCEYLQTEIPATSSVLELGGGYCGFINNIQAADKHVLDVYEGVTTFAGREVQSHVCSCEDLDIFAAQRFDIVFASNLFEHLTREQLHQSLLEVWRVLKPAGKLIIIQPNFKYSYKDYFDDYTHLQIFTETSLTDLLRTHGFQVTSVVPRFLPFSLKGRGPKWRWLLRLYLRLPFRPFAGQMYVISVKPEVHA
jgi:ubiquinone/menaquinone biosynthesis C-methylase UbiE